MSLRPSLVVDAASGALLRANRSCEDFWGYPPPEFRGMALRDLIDAATADAFFAAAAQDRAFASSSVTIRQRSGATHLVEVSAAPAEPGAWELRFREPGRLGQARELRRLNFALSAYARSSAALIQMADSARIMAQVCEAIVGQEAYVLACVAMPPRDGGPWLDFAAAAGPARDYLDGLRLSASAERPEGQGATGRTVRTGVPHLIHDSRKDAIYSPWRERGERFGIRSTVTVPIPVRGRTAGALLVYASKPDAFGPRELNLFVRLCEEIGLALTIEDGRRRMREAEEARQAAEARAQSANAQLQRFARVSFMGEFAAALAHEVNQPLGAIRINAEAGLRWLNRATPDLAEVKSALERIGRDATRANEIIGRTRAMYGTGETAAAPFDLREAVEEVLVITREQRREAGVELDAATGGACLALGDRTQAQQVAFNLVANALDALSLVSGEPRRLGVAILREKDQARVVVEDSGPGVALAVRDHLFERFFTTKPQGTGLGLALSRRIVEMQGGRLWFEPLSPHGARFQFTLPLAPA